MTRGPAANNNVIDLNQVRQELRGAQFPSPAATEVPRLPEKPLASSLPEMLPDTERVRRQFERRAARDDAQYPPLRSYVNRSLDGHGTKVGADQEWSSERFSPIALEARAGCSVAILNHRTGRQAAANYISADGMAAQLLVREIASNPRHVECVIIPGSEKPDRERGAQIFQGLLSAGVKGHQIRIAETGCPQVILSDGQLWDGQARDFKQHSSREAGSTAARAVSAA